MKILIAGCGYLGTELGKRLLGRGDEVWALRRDLQALAALERLGFYLFKADLTDPSSITDLPQVDLVVACQAPGREETYQAAYGDGTRNLLAALQKRPPKRMILVSSTSVYGTMDGSWVDEATPAEVLWRGRTGPEADNARCLLGAEAACLGSGIPSIILRLGGLYGPGRNRLAALKTGRMRPSFSKTLFANRVHVRDAASAILLLSEKGVPGEIYLGVDDAPSTQEEFYGWLCPQLGLPVTAAPADTEATAHGSNKRCSNKKLRALGFVPEYPDFRRGYQGLFAEAIV